MKKKYGRKIQPILTLVLAGMMLGGCGGEEQVSYMQQGMEAVEALEYNEALTCFKNGQDKGEDERLLYRGMGIA